MILFFIKLTDLFYYNIKLTDFIDTRRGNYYLNFYEVLESNK